MEPVSNEICETVQKKEVSEPSKLDTDSEQQNAETDVTDTSEPVEKSAPAADSDKSIEELDSSISENAMEIVESPEVSRSENENQNTSAEVSMEVDQDAPSENVSKADNTDKDTTAESTKDDNKTEEPVAEKHDHIDNDKDKTSDEQKICENVEESDKTEKNSKTNEKDSGDEEEPASNSNVEESNGSEKDSSGKEKNSSAYNDTKKSSDDSQPAEEDSTKNSSEAPPSEQALECDVVIMESENGKETANGKSEVENTEFVQFSNQDKDDSQLENQPDAEDPFGGDNLANNTDNGEPMEVDSASNDKNSKPTEEDDSSKEAESSKEKDKDVPSIDKPEEEEGSKSEKEPTDKESKSATETPSTESSEKKKESSTAEILPGQDDELCIIPDSTKENKDNTKEKKNDTQSTEEEKEKEKEQETEKEKEKENEIVIEEEPVVENKISEDSDKDKRKTEASQPAEADTEKSGLKVAAISSGANDIQVNVGKSSDIPTIVTSDIIDIDDDAKNPEIEEIASKEVCKQCNQEKTCNIKVKVGAKTFNVCSDECKTAFSADNNKATDIPSEGVNSKRDKRCASCLLIVEAKDERNLSWETMEFCNEECLGKFQTKYGSYCRNCNGAVQPVSLGKYCVRFGYDVRQFCCSTCLEEFKKGLKVCSYCQKDISAGTEGFLAPVGDKGQFKDFCTQDCMEKYSKMNSTEPPPPEEKLCGVCQEKKVMHCEVQIDRNPSVPICSEPCFAAFKFVNKVDPDQCTTCKKYFQLPTKTGFVVFYEDEAHTFCNKTCLNVFIITNRKIVPCNWCKVKKYNFDMIKKELKSGQVMMMCSLNCLTLYQVSINAVSARRINCDFCKEFSQAQYHLTMSDATIRNFCSYKCVMNFQAQYTKSPITIPSGETNATAATTPTGPAGLTPIGAGDPVPTGIPKRAVLAAPPSAPPRPIQPAPATDSHVQLAQKKSLPVISSVTSLAALANGQSQNSVQIANANQPSIGSTMQPITLQGTAPVIYKQQVVTRPTSPIDMANKMTQCKPHMHTKGVSVRPVPCTQSTQTEGVHPVIVPIPVPIYVPFPVHMYSMPFPVPVPIPIPIPVPIFIPTTRNTYKGVIKELKRIQEKTPADPFEAELLMMAEMVATEKKSESDSDSNDEAPEDADAEAEVNDSAAPADSYSPEGETAFGEDMLQMALKIATGELDEPAVDLDTELTPSTIHVPQKQNDEGNENQAPTMKPHAPRGRKRSASHRGRGGAKRGRRAVNSNDVNLLSSADGDTANQQRFVKPVERPDANMALKYTFGVNAWRQWVITKNAELEKQSTPTRKLKLFKTDLLQLTADELNYSLCLFVKEVRKPNGAEYEPDTIYYLCLGIQQYLFENNRIDNIFTDAYYEKFTDCLNEVAKKFTTLYSNALYVVTRVEEEHLWECKQLGAHSPHVLLNTLMYFNTKHFNLVTVDEHMQLSFSHIMKHWKRNPAAQPSAVAGKAPGSRNVLLRFYPPQAALEANSKKKKVYEQQENEENPLRCPVKLYEFYLSKCPESVKTRNDVFYLLPERSCVPDSPVWYSTSPLAKEHLIKMIHRIKMVKEINVALLTS